MIKLLKLYLAFTAFFITFSHYAQNLSSITLSNGKNLEELNQSYSFRKTYYPNDIQTTLTVEFESGSASYSINSTTGELISGEATASIPLPKGESELNIVYTSDTGEEITYTVYLIRPIPITNIIIEGSTDTNAADYEAGDYLAVLTPTFDQTIDSYEITVPHNVVKARVIWTVDDTGSQNVTGYNTHVGWLNGNKLESPTNTFTSIWGNINVGRTQWGPQYTTQTPHGSAGTDHIMTYITRKSSLEGPGITNINFSADENENASISFSSDLVLGSSTNDLKILITAPDGSQIILTRDDFQFSANNMTYTLISTLNLSSPGNYSLSIINALDVYGVDGGNAGSGEQLDISIDIASSDTTPPVITVQSAPSEWLLGQNYSDAGAIAVDDVDGDITDQIVTDLSGLPNNGTPLDQIGTFFVVYTVSDAAGNEVSNFREITVLDVTAPVVELVGDAVIDLEVFSDYIEPGYNATDDYDTNLTVTIDGSVNTSILGGYTLTYTATDQSGNVSNPVYRTVVIRDNTPPVISLIGDTEITIQAGTLFEDPGVSVSDNYDSDLDAVLEITGEVDETALGDYVITYNVNDTSGNAAQSVIRTVSVIDTTPPVITVSYTESTTPYGVYDLLPLATAEDNLDGDISDNLTFEGWLNTCESGTHEIVYSVSDSQGNEAIPVTVTYTVLEDDGSVPPMQDDFDGNSSGISWWSGFSGVSTYYVEENFSPEYETQGNSLMYYDSGENNFAHMRLASCKKIDLNAHGNLSMKVYVQAEDIEKATTTNMRVFIQNIGNPENGNIWADQIELETTITETNTWVDVNFDFSSVLESVGRVDFDSFFIQFNGGDDISSEFTAFIDDISSGSSTTDFSASTPGVAPRPDEDSVTNSVMSVFGDHYDNFATIGNTNPYWNQTGKFHTITLNNEPLWRYLDMNYQGHDIAVFDYDNNSFNNPWDLSEATHVHLDLWTPIVEQVRFFLLDLSNTLGQESYYTIETNAGSWTSIEVPIADFRIIQNFDNNLYQLKFEPAGIAPLMYMANLYFFTDPSLKIETFDGGNLKVYPNPTATNWNFEMDTVIHSIEIYDIHGKQIMHVKPQLRRAKIGTERLERGMYLGRINGSKTVQLLKH